MISHLINYLHTRFIKPEIKKYTSRLKKNILFYLIPRELHFIKALTYIQNVDGAIAEAGVRDGNSLLFLAGAARSMNMKRKIIAIDSFEGFPSDYYYESLKRDKPKAELTKEEAIQSIKFVLKNADFNEDDFDLVPGYFKDSLKKYNHGPIALLHLDVDLGGSYKEALEYLYPHVVKGGIILFDEYYEEFTKYKDAKSAIDKFLKDKSYQKIFTGFEKKLAIKKL
tara:strand:- start:58 stop:732 length:675 start_codon:yes stop_codon:yes gene_type:complete